MPALQQLESDLTAADGFYAGKLDPDKRNAILRTVMGDRQRLEAKDRARSRSARRQGERVIGEIDRQIASGIPARAEMWVAWSDAVKGTPLLPTFRSGSTKRRKFKRCCGCLSISSWRSFRNARQP